MVFDLKQISDDFITVGNIALLLKITGNDVYDFRFRDYFECKSIFQAVDVPVMLHIGAIEDYAGTERLIHEMGMRLLVNEEEHLLCSTIEKWYPILAENTPFTKVYTELPPIEELQRHFAFPVFLKGNRQTNRHKRSQCIIENEEHYRRIQEEWKRDDVLFWQKVAVREYIPLEAIDSESFPNMVPISKEFRFFYYYGKCVAYGPYWYMGRSYSVSGSELSGILQLTDWAAKRLDAAFITIDAAKTADGEWIIIEVNDAQESGFVGVNPLVLWRNIIDTI